MRFEAFLLEGDMEREYTTPRSKEIKSPDEVENLIRTKCKTAWKAWRNKRATIQRGTPKSWNYMLSDPRQSKIRLSANTRSYMNLLVDNLPSWKGYPQRGKSLICTTFHQSARAYGRGNAFVVLPFENAKIGVCNEMDFWLSFKMLRAFGDDVSDFNDGLSDLFFESKISLSGSEKSWSRLKEGLESVEKNLKEKDYKTKSRMISNFWDFYLDTKPVSLLKFLSEQLNPLDNGFERAKPGNEIPTGHEVWTDSPAVLVHTKNEEWLEDLKI